MVVMAGPGLVTFSSNPIRELTPRCLPRSVCLKLGRMTPSEDNPQRGEGLNQLVELPSRETRPFVPQSMI